MSILKITSGYSSNKMISYCSQEKIDRLSGEKIERCTAWKNNLVLTHPEHVAMAWEVTREGFGKCSGRQYHHASLSLDPKDPQAQKITDPKMIRMAEKFVQEYAPGHDYSIFIHRDKEHPHAHILWNSVHSETGLKFHASKEDLMRGMEIKDSIDKEFGLKITTRNKIYDRIPDPVKRLHERNPFSYLWMEDLKQRIETIRAHTSDFPSYQAHLKHSGVEADPRGKEGKVSYRFLDHEGKQRQCRESKLGDDYGRETLERHFERNREQHQGNAAQRRHTDLDPSDQQRIKIRTGRTSPVKERTSTNESKLGAHPLTTHGVYELNTPTSRASFKDSFQFSEQSGRLRELGKEFIGAHPAGSFSKDDPHQTVGGELEREQPYDVQSITRQHTLSERVPIILSHSSDTDRSFIDSHGMDSTQFLRSEDEAEQRRKQYSNSPLQENTLNTQVMEFRHVVYSRAERGLNPGTDQSAPRNEQRRNDRIYTEYQQGLVQVFCITRARSQIRYSEYSRNQQNRTEEIGKAFSREVKDNGNAIGRRITAKIQRLSEVAQGWYNTARERLSNLQERAEAVLRSSFELKKEHGNQDLAIGTLEKSMGTTLEKIKKLIPEKNNLEDKPVELELEMGRDQEKQKSKSRGHGIGR
jgi:hypothetical protein